MAWEPVDYDPFAQDAPPRPEAPPKQGFWAGVKDSFTGEGRTEFPEAQEFGPAHEQSLPSESIPAMQRQTVGGKVDAFSPEAQAAEEWRAGQRAVTTSAVTPDPQAQLDILKKAIPGLESKNDKFGNVMVKTPNMKDFAYLNKPGLSARDMQEFGVQTAATAPVLGLAGWGAGLSNSARGLMANMLRGGAGLTGASVTQDALAGQAGSEQGIDAERAAISGGIGAALPLAGKAITGTAAGIASVGENIGDFVRSGTRAGAQAQREVRGAFAQDLRSGGLNPIGPADRAAAASRGQDLRTMDFGGETVRALARKSANISPAARDTIMRVIGPRNERMAVGRRGESIVQNEFGLARSSELARRDLQQQARNARNPLYFQAYAQGAGGIDSPVLQQLQTSPIFQRAMQYGENLMRDRMATPGWRTTGLRGPNGHPTLEYWDHVKQALDDYAGSAFGQNERSRGALLSQMARDLRTELDRHVPLYRQARGTAATFFDAADALEAGANFARGGRYNMDDATRAIQALNPAERDLFREGFADILVQRIRQNPNYLNQIRDIPAEYDRARLALGAQNFDQLEGFLRLEQLMKRMNNAMGNSTTARQLSEIEQRFGGSFWNALGGGAVGGGMVTLSPTAMVLGVLIAGGKRAHDVVDRRVAEEVATLLTSTDPDVFLQGLRQLGNNRILDALRAFDHILDEARIPRNIAAQTAVNTNSYEPIPQENR